MVKYLYCHVIDDIMYEEMRKFEKAVVKIKMV